MDHAELLDVARKAIIALTEDTRVPKSQTKEELEELRDDIESYISAIDEEEEDEEEEEEGEEEEESKEEEE